MGAGSAVVVLHSTETDGPASYNGTEPHFEVYVSPIGGVQIRQFIALSNTAKALYNAAGGVETNRRAGHVIQIEIVGRAGQAQDWPDAKLQAVAKVVRWIREQLPFALNIPRHGFRGAGEGIVLASEDSPIRFTFAEWNAFEGICGHQHLPENDHWDPGRINIQRLLVLIQEEDDMTTEDRLLLLEILGLCRSSNGELGQLAVVVRDPSTGLGRVVGDLARTLDRQTPAAVQVAFAADTLAAIAKAVNDDAARRRQAWS